MLRRFWIGQKCGVARQCLPLVFVVILLHAHNGQAWNPLKAIADGLAAAGRAIGGVLGAPLGGFINAAAAPTLRTGQQLIADADARVGARIQQAGSTVDGIIDHANQAAGLQLNHADSILAARITQVKVGTDDLLHNALGGIDEISRKRLEEANRDLQAVVAKVNVDVKDRLQQADGILKNQLVHVQGIVSQSIAEADQAIAARIDQLDEVAARNLGSVDVIATKQTLNLEKMLLKTASLIALVVFVAFALWRFLVVEYPSKRAALEKRPTKVAVIRAKTGHALGWFAPRVAAAAAGVAVLYALSAYLPLGSRRDANHLIKVHSDALNQGLASLDFAQVRYHAAQLAILEPENGIHRALALKSELIRTALGRPALLMRVDGVQELIALVNQVEGVFAGLPGKKTDPDVLVVKAYVLWQVGSTRRDEQEAATLCAQALEIPAKDRPAAFLLHAVARNYIERFLYQPTSASNADAGLYDVARLTIALRNDAQSSTGVSETRLQAPGDGNSGPLRDVVAYDLLVERLDRESTAAYLQMLQAHADFLKAKKALGAMPTDARAASALTEAKKQRSAAAERVVQVWESFDAALDNTSALIGSPVVVATLKLNDAVLSHALWFRKNPEATSTAPELARVKSVQARVQMAPVRIAWARRYVGPFGKALKTLIELEAVDVFKNFESKVIEFESEFVALQTADSKPAGETKNPALGAALAAARLGLYSTAPNGNRERLADQILNGRVISEPDRQQINSFYEQRQLRFL